MSSMYDDPRRSFLAHVPEELRSQITNVLLARVRVGAHSPQTVIDDALRRLRERVGGWGREDPNVREMLGLLIRHRADALLFAAWCIEWEQLPAAEKERQKASRGEEYRHRWLDEQPPTPKQIGYCRSLGYTGEIRSKRHASELIDGLKRARAS
ncbi:MAG: hypothetical protein M3Q65_17870 [Chloroflexota bacterium]|nr:hypothetical protein [Chloroflexota bacterium]